jgi:hypothetical protein
MSKIWARNFFEDIFPGDCEFLALPEGDNSNARDRLAYYAEMRDYLEHEDALINSRLTLSLTVHGFLFAAYGLILGKAIDFGAELSKNSVSTSSKPMSLIVLFLLLILVALTGAVVGLFSRNAIVAGFNAIQHINRLVHAREPLNFVPAGERNQLVAPQGATRWLLPNITSGGAPTERVEGAYYYYCWLPMLLFGVWIILAGAAIYLLVTRPITGAFGGQTKQTIFIDLAPLTNIRAVSSSFQFLGCVGPFLSGNDSSVATSPSSQKCGSIDDTVKRINQSLTRQGMLTSLLVVGSADKFELTSQLRAEYGANSGLARARTKTIIDRLVKSNVIPAEQVIAVTVGPKVYGKRLSRAQTASDRTVSIWGFFSN